MDELKGLVIYGRWKITSQKSIYRVWMSYRMREFVCSNVKSYLPLVRIFPLIPFCLSLKNIDMSRKTKRTSKLISNEEWILSTKKVSWFVTESPGRKPDWLFVIKLFDTTCLKIEFFQRFQQRGGGAILAYN